eukprot:6205185-Pleurochrysis_carterae.AAC.4
MNEPLNLFFRCLGTHKPLPCKQTRVCTGAMRYQADRKFHQLDSSLASLELTEISAADAETYLPDFNTGQ